MNTLVRLSIVYAGFIIPIRLARHRNRMIRTYIFYALGYYAMIRVGFASVDL